MASLFIGFLVEKTSLVKVGNPISDGIVFVFTLLDQEDCKVWSDTGFSWYLSGAASRMVSQRNYCIWCLFFGIYFNEFRFETMIWPSIRFDVSLQNFKKPLDSFSPQIERKRSKEYLVIILAGKESFERFSRLEFVFEKSNHREAGKPA